jgi:type I restriction enzyme S subunit
MTSVMKRIRIGNIGKVVTGTTPPTQNEEYYGGDFLFIKPSDITPSIRRVFTSETKLSFAGHDYLRGKELPRNTTCVVCIGTIGKLCLTSTLSFTNQQINSVLPNPKDFDPVYVYYLLSTTIPKLQKIQGGSASGREHVNKSNLENIEVEVHALPAQRKIAGILSAYDDLIENNTRRIAILEQMAQSIYWEWFVNFRFPGHQNVKLVDTPLGKIPEGWKVSPLSDIADVNALSIKKGKEPDEVNYVDIASVSTGTIDEVRLLSFSEAPGRARRIVRHGDLIWSTVRPNRKSYSLILNPLPNMIASTGFAVISGTKAPFSYLYHALTTDDFVGYLVNHATGSAYPAVNSGDFEKATILVPSQDVLAAFHEMTEPMFLAQHCMVEKNKKLRASRDLLLPKLISGQLDVEELDIETGEPLVEAEA